MFWSITVTQSSLKWIKVENPCFSRIIWLRFHISESSNSVLKLFIEPKAHWKYISQNRSLYNFPCLPLCFDAVVSNHILSVATFATIVVTTVLLSPRLSEFERYAVNEPLEINFWTTVCLYIKISCRHTWKMAKRLNNECFVKNDLFVNFICSFYDKFYQETNNLQFFKYIRRNTH